MKRIVALTMLMSWWLAAVAIADTIIFKDSWGPNPLALWDGEKLAAYSVDPSSHSITDLVELSPFENDEQGFVSKIVYNKSIESWSGRGSQAEGILVTGKIDLTGTTSLTWKARADASMNADVVIDKWAMKDSDGNEIVLHGPALLSKSNWTTFTTSPGIFDGRNLSKVGMIFSFFISRVDNAAITANEIIFYLDDVICIGSGKTSTVEVIVTSGIVGLSVEQVVNFDALGDIAADTSYNSADIGNAENSHFIVKNTGTVQVNYSLNLIDPAGWKVANPVTGAAATSLQEIDTYALWALFSGTGESPAGNLANFGAEDAVISSPREASDARFAFTSNNGINVPFNTQRNLWIALHTPPLSSVGTAQQIIVVVTAKKI